MDATGVPTSTLSVTVEPNLGHLRTVVLTIHALQQSGNGYVQTGAQYFVTVTQPMGSCPYSFDKTTQNISGLKYTSRS
ncbi:MAG: hypothetical protein ABI882_14620 [Acidobacteriota bacterium]